MSLKRRLLAGLTVFAALVVVGIAALFVAYDRTLYEPPDGPRPTIVLRNGMLFDGTGAAARPNPGIVLSDGVIACMGAECTAPAGAMEIDATGLAILPGFGARCSRRALPRTARSAIRATRCSR